MSTRNYVFVLLVGKAVDGGNKKEVKGKGSFKKSSKFANVIMASKKMSTAKKTPKTSSTSSIFDGEMLPDEDLPNRFNSFLFSSLILPKECGIKLGNVRCEGKDSGLKGEY